MRKLPREQAAQRHAIARGRAPGAAASAARACGRNASPAPVKADATLVAVKQRLAELALEPGATGRLRPAAPTESRAAARVTWALLGHRDEEGEVTQFHN